MKSCLPLDVDGARAHLAFEELDEIDVRCRPRQVSQEDRSPSVLARHLDSVVELEKGRVGSLGEVHKLRKVIHGC